MGLYQNSKGDIMLYNYLLEALEWYGKMHAFYFTSYPNFDSIFQYSIEFLLSYKEIINDFISLQQRWCSFSFKINSTINTKGHEERLSKQAQKRLYCWLNIICYLNFWKIHHHANTQYDNFIKIYKLQLLP